MKLINLLLFIYYIIVAAIFTMFVFFIDIENEITIAFFLVLGMILLQLLKYCIKLKSGKNKYTR